MLNSSGKINKRLIHEINTNDYECNLLCSRSLLLSRGAMSLNGFHIQLDNAIGDFPLAVCSIFVFIRHKFSSWITSPQLLRMNASKLLKLPHGYTD